MRVSWVGWVLIMTVFLKEGQCRIVSEDKLNPLRGEEEEEEHGLLKCEYYNPCGDGDPSSPSSSSSSSSLSSDSDCQDPRVYSSGKAVEKFCPLDHVCYAVWYNSTDESHEGPKHWSKLKVKRMGCIPSQNSHLSLCTQDDHCLEDKYKSASSGPTDHLFCCCQTDMCNSKFRWEPKIPASTRSPPTNLPMTYSSNTNFLLAIYIMIPVLVLSVLIAAGVLIYRQRKVGEFNSLSANSDGESPGLDHPSTPALSNREIQLIEIKARGRFGAVWKGMYNNSHVAVKIFPLQDKQSWYAEQQIYNLPQMNHDNILQFLGVEKRGESLSQEFWLTTTFHERGSLCDYLKSNTVSWEDLCKIAQSMARGLTHLHEEIPSSNKIQGMKPAIAHRDFKSKNVLLKSDMTACIGDFGLALVFEPCQSCGDTHGQVGTRRYMAPEVLEGAINFSRDAFLRIDMYACGLVLWELLSRLKTSSLNPEEYKLPFEAEANHPTLEEMQDLVVTRKIRPAIKGVWRNHPGVNALCDTIEECWDHDAEARLSASCVTERIKVVHNYRITQLENCVNESILLTSMSTPFISNKEDSLAI